ncbi:LysR family transcriptional regulator [Aliiroseovarius sp. PTFE2010]|uniref:LysR family transcriptional regulator n=1 Tax=Aliiroseovarius sp. PTFE2010 TaxID=3417190 RepID=UPI003CECD5A2
MRNLDLTALRSFVAVADSGGVTRAAGLLNLTQSAVSMQLKRLEQSLGAGLLDRSGRGVALTSEGEQLVSYARRMLELNDEAYARLTSQEYEGEIHLGVPHDIIYPIIPRVLQQFNARYPRVKVNLYSSFTSKLKEQFNRGQVDVILTTEEEPDRGGQVMATMPLVWLGARGGSAWRQRPLRLAFEKGCAFRPRVQRALDEHGVAWEMATNSEQSRTIEAMVQADLAVYAQLEGTYPKDAEPIQHGGALPDLPSSQVILYANEKGQAHYIDDVAELLRAAYSVPTKQNLHAVAG